jgi:hypothetical protein
MGVIRRTGAIATVISTVISTVIAAAIAAGAAACAPSVRTVSPRAGIETEVAPGAHTVEAGRRLTVRMSQPLDSALSREGEPFTATLVAPLVARDGRLIAHEGALVRGLVVATDSGAGPNLTLELHSIETVAGPAPIAAYVVDAGTIAYAAPRGLARDAWSGTPQPPGQTTLRAGPLTAAATAAAAEGWPRAGATREVRLPLGATLELVLARPLALPAAR